MGSLFNAAAALWPAAAILGTGPAAGLGDPHREPVKADLAAARPEESLAGQVWTLFRAGTPRPDMDR